MADGLVHVGGSFTTIGGVPRHRFAALDVLTAQPNAWAPDVNGTVLAVVPSRGTACLAGQFTSVDGQVRNRFAAIDLATGRLNDTLHVSHGTVYAGGEFSQVNDIASRGLAVFEP